MVFRATRKLMLWYLEQQENSCFVFRAKRKSMLKVIRATRKSMPQFQEPFFFWKLRIWVKFPNQTWNNRNATLINSLIGSIFWNRNISCHDTVKLTARQSRLAVISWAQRWVSTGDVLQWSACSYLISVSDDCRDIISLAHMKLPRKQITGGIAQVLNVMQSSSWRNRVSFDWYYATFVTRC